MRHFTLSILTILTLVMHNAVAEKRTGQQLCACDFTFKEGRGPGAPFNNSGPYGLVVECSDCKSCRCLWTQHGASSYDAGKLGMKAQCGDNIEEFIPFIDQMVYRKQGEQKEYKRGGLPPVYDWSGDTSGQYSKSFRKNCGTPQNKIAAQ